MSPYKVWCRTWYQSCHSAIFQHTFNVTILTTSLLTVTILSILFGSKIVIVLFQRCSNVVKSTLKPWCVFFASKSYDTVSKLYHRWKSVVCPLCFFYQLARLKMNLFWYRIMIAEQVKKLWSKESSSDIENNIVIKVSYFRNKYLLIVICLLMNMKKPTWHYHFTFC